MEIQVKAVILNALELLYWSYFSFYRSVMKDSAPHLLATLAISMSEAMLVIPICDYTMARLLCHSISKLAMFTILASALLLNYLYLHSTGRALRIVQTRIEKSKRAHLLASGFFLLCVVAFFEVPGIVHELLKRCS